MDLKHSDSHKMWSTLPLLIGSAVILVMTIMKVRFQMSVISRRFREKQLYIIICFQYHHTSLRWMNAFTLVTTLFSSLYLFNLRTSGLVLVVQLESEWLLPLMSASSHFFHWQLHLCSISGPSYALSLFMSSRLCCTLCPLLRAIS